MPIANPAVVVPFAARMRSGHMSAKKDCEAAVAIMTKIYFATAFLTVMRRI